MLGLMMLVVVRKLGPFVLQRRALGLATLQVMSITRAILQPARLEIQPAVGLRDSSRLKPFRLLLLVNILLMLR